MTCNVSDFFDAPIVKGSVMFDGQLETVFVGKRKMGKISL